MRTTISAIALSMALAAPVHADEVKLGLLNGFTGPIESVAGNMARASELAIEEINASGLFLGGRKITSVRADSTCIDAAVATAAAERLVHSDKVDVIIGDGCSGSSAAVLQNVAMPNGILMISPAATSPALSTIPDDGLFFRTSPSDARQGEVLATVMIDRGLKEVAITYTNTDYGKGLSDSIKSAFEAKGGKVTLVVPHEDGKGDYSAEVGSLASAGGEALVIAGFLDQGGKGMLQGSLDVGAFDLFVLPDGMIGDSLAEAIGPALDGSFGTTPGSDSDGAVTFAEVLKTVDLVPGPYMAEWYDAVALAAFAMQAAGSTEGALVKEKVFDVANAPGEKIMPGELAKGLKILAEGGKIDYVGASAVELIEPGESAGTFREIEIRGGVTETVSFR
ncbi:ABC transporter substrate-binding protein [Aerobium aerolatum]|uniref:Amino acid/amide ABC transporter substrate-binding protein, HAAT family n=1 Tax=Aquamicrobium aerolatum DSM 21857 TaxID=1121003 RepID=A0A1I3I3G8_9HYPH|nr:ABC transporter substrate-binding protein [Aquamicrobium aerolatum]SFI42548.1 amino acid/amide ABC transporter substrate-binding protein, HAAT family [Aquamicrobium aerolatum DSM 21857]